MLAITLPGAFKTILLLGSIQGFIVSSLLFFSKKKKYSNRILGTLILLITLACFNLYGNYENWFDSDILRFITDLIPLVIIMPFGPLIWFYVQAVLDPSFRIQKKQRIHFYPVIVDFVPPVVVIIYVIGLLTGLLKNKPGPWGVFIDTYNVYADIPRWISLTSYVLVSAKYLKAYKAKVNDNLNEQTDSYKWLRQLINVFIAFQSLWLVYLIPYVIPQYTDKILNIFDWYPLYIPMTILIYWIGIKGFLISQGQSTADKKINPGNIISPKIAAQVTGTLIKAMHEDKAYLNPNLNLATLSEHTGVAAKTISAVLNQHLQKSFNEFVNGYRINEFKERILQPELNNLTIAGIAMECGFNSQATFQRTFKEITGQSPSEFRKLAIETN
ncbi:MAG: helix-turn-helix transcriptional regulator [Bacteroidetes bacterium]|nr:helix-turn-helix transcriptional regulator [Bacteroidota bacterium]